MMTALWECVNCRVSLRIRHGFAVVHVQPACADFLPRLASVVTIVDRHITVVLSHFILECSLPSCTPLFSLQSARTLPSLLPSVWPSVRPSGGAVLALPGPAFDQPVSLSGPVAVFRVVASSLELAALNSGRGVQLANGLSEALLHLCSTHVEARDMHAHHAPRCVFVSKTFSPLVSISPQLPPAAWTCLMGNRAWLLEQGLLCEAPWTRFVLAAAASALVAATDPLFLIIDFCDTPSEPRFAKSLKLAEEWLQPFATFVPRTG
jgi:hypothetical protein